MWNYSPSLWLFRLLKNEVISASLQQAKNELKQTGVTGSIAANNVIHSETKSVACISIMVVAFCPKAVYIFSSSPICLPECRFILEIHTLKNKKKKKTPKHKTYRTRLQIGDLHMQSAC